MGAQKSKAAIQKVAKPVKDFNILERSIRQIDKQKENPAGYVAPRHGTSAERIREQIEAHPEIPEEVKKHDPSLIDRVNKLHIDVDISGVPKILSNPNRPLPVGREVAFSPMEPYLNPNKQVKGCLTLTQIMLLLDEYSKNPSREYCEKKAIEYNVDFELIKNLVIHYIHATVNPDKVFETEYQEEEVDPEYSLTLKERINRHLSESKMTDEEFRAETRKLIEEKYGKEEADSFSRDEGAAPEEEMPDPFSRIAEEELENETKDANSAKTGV